MIYNSLNTLAKCSVLRYDQDTYSVTFKLDTYLQIRGHHNLREINNILDNFIMYYSTDVIASEALHWKGKKQ